MFHITKNIPYNKNEILKSVYKDSSKPSTFLTVDDAYIKQNINNYNKKYTAFGSYNKLNDNNNNSNN